MTAHKRINAKGRRESGSFVAVPHAVLEHENYARLKPRAVKLLLDLYGQYRGNNNGDFSMAWSMMEKRGWTSRDQLNKARKQLLETGWIVLTRQGGKHLPSLYAVTFLAIDECKGKLDMRSTKTALGYWKLGYNSLEKNFVTLDTGHINPSAGLTPVGSRTN